MLELSTGSYSFTAPTARTMYKINMAMADCRREPKEGETNPGASLDLTRLAEVVERFAPPCYEIGAGDLERMTAADWIKLTHDFTEQANNLAKPPEKKS